MRRCCGANRCAVVVVDRMPCVLVAALRFDLRSPAGRYASDFASSSCDTCPFRHYATREGQSACTRWCVRDCAHSLCARLFARGFDALMLPAGWTVDSFPVWFYVLAQRDRRSERHHVSAACRRFALLAVFCVLCLAVTALMMGCEWVLRVRCASARSALGCDGSLTSLSFVCVIVSAQTARTAPV